MFGGRRGPLPTVGNQVPFTEGEKVGWGAKDLGESLGVWVWEELRVGEILSRKGQHAFSNSGLKLRRREAGWDTDTGGRDLR